MSGHSGECPSLTPLAKIDINWQSESTIITVTVVSAHILDVEDLGYMSRKIKNDLLFFFT